MNKHQYIGFVKRANYLGYTEKQANDLLDMLSSAKQGITQGWNSYKDWGADKLDSIVNRDANMEAKVVGHNTNALNNTADYIKKVLPWDQEAMKAPGKALSAISRLGTEGFTSQALNQPPPLPNFNGLVNKAIHGSTPSDGQFYNPEALIKAKGW